MMKTLSPDAAQDISVQALTFIAGDPEILSRFLGATGYTAESLHAPDTRERIPLAALDFLMGAEDLLLTFAANAGLDPAVVAGAHHTLQTASGTADNGHS
ncbi:MAG: DUF3572 family protein [Pseudomonadota bacterium]